jgi:hypothetical protein
MSRDRRLNFGICLNFGVLWNLQNFDFDLEMKDSTARECISHLVQLTQYAFLFPLPPQLGPSFVPLHPPLTF